MPCPRWGREGLSRLGLLLPYDHLVIKPMDVVRDIREAIFHCKMPGFEPVHLGLRKICQICFSALASEKDVVLPPEDDRRRLMLPEEFLPLRIQHDVITVVIEEIKLDLPPVLLLQRGVVIGVPVSGLINSGSFAPCRYTVFTVSYASKPSTPASFSGVRLCQRALRRPPQASVNPTS